MDPNIPFVSEESQILYDCDALDVKLDYEKDGKIRAFEKAGPRKKIFFDPGWCKAAILTAGGLCPGLTT